MMFVVEAEFSDSEIFSMNVDASAETAGSAALLLIYGLFLSISFADMKSFIIVVVCTAVFLVISFGICAILDHAVREPTEIFTMTDTYVQMSSNKSKEYFLFEKAKDIEFTQKYIELRGKVRKIRVYVPSDDMEFVKGYILSRVRL